MGIHTYSCSNCKPIDSSILAVYIQLVEEEKSVSANESNRVTAENGRVEAEEERTRVFAADHGTAQDDHTIAAGDHVTAGDDHLLAVADHGTAGDDHTIAAGDHVTAGEDHLASTSATSRANDAAAAAEHMVDLHQGPPGEDGKSPYIGLNGNWYVWDDTTQQYVDSGERAQGRDGNPGSSQDYPFELVNDEETNDSTKAHTAAGGKRLQDQISQLEAEVHNLSGNYYGVFEDSLSLPEGDAPGYAFVGTESPFAIYNFDGDAWADSGATVDGIQGEPGIGFGSISTPSTPDGTAVITLSNGDTITLDLNHEHAGYCSKVLGGAQPSGGFLPDVVYSLGTLTGTVAFTLAAAVTGNVNHYFWMFDTGVSAPTVTWPAGLTWAAGAAPTVAASKHYEISVLGGVAYYSEV